MERGVRRWGGAAIACGLALLSGAPVASARTDGRGAEGLLVRVENPGGARLEWVLPPGTLRAVLLLGPALGTPPRGGLALDPLRVLLLPIDPVGRGSWEGAGFDGLRGLAAQVRFSSADGRGVFSNAVELGRRVESAAPTGEVVIREFLADPRRVPDADGEWIEVQSLASVRLDLAGWSLGDGRFDFHRIAPPEMPLWILPGERLVLAAQGDPARNGGFRPDYVYAGLVLANTSDTIELRDRRGRLVDVVRYDARTWPVRPGRSTALLEASTDAWANDHPAAWYATGRELPRPRSAGGQEFHARPP